MNDRIRELAFFLRVSEETSFSAAARSLDLDPSTISKVIQRLENRLGVRLFHRTSRVLQHVAAEVVAGRWVTVLPALALPPEPIYAVYASKRQLNPRVRVFLEHVASHLLETCAACAPRTQLLFPGLTCRSPSTSTSWPLGRNLNCKLHEPSPAQACRSAP